MGSIVLLRIYKITICTAIAITPGLVFAWDIGSIKDAASTFKNAAVEVYHDNNTYNDNPLRKEIEPLIDLLKEEQEKRIQRIEQLKLTNNVLALELEEDAARKDCSNLPFVADLSQLIEKNCNTAAIRDECEKSNHAIFELAKWAKKAEPTTKSGSVTTKIFETEKVLGDILKSMTAKNEICSNHYSKSLTNNICSNTYRAYFNDFKSKIVRSCSDTSLIHELEKFVTEMRNTQHAFSIDLIEAAKFHSQSRSMEIDVAEKLERLNADRLRLEKALGKTRNLEQRVPAQDTNQLENYLGS